MERRAARRKFGVDDLEVFDKVGAKAKPVKCKGIDEVAYEAEFKDDPDAILSAPLSSTTRVFRARRPCMNSLNVHRSMVSCRGITRNFSG